MVTTCLCSFTTQTVCHCFLLQHTTRAKYLCSIKALLIPSPSNTENYSSVNTASSFFFIFSTSLLCHPYSASLGAEARRDPSSISSLISKQLFKTIFLHKDGSACPAKDFYTYKSFIQAAKSFPEFGTAGNISTRKREIAAFLAQISHETTGGWATDPDGPFAWGLCFEEELKSQSNYRDSNNTQRPCNPGKGYFGRGPIQLSWNFNYGPAGKALGYDGLMNPEIGSNNPVIAFKTALWFWMTERKPIPSPHSVMVGEYVPTKTDTEANRTAGYGLVTNIINGELGVGSLTTPE